MFLTVRQRLRDDDGISLVEILVSIVIVGITLAAVLATIVTSLSSVQQNEARVRATALSQELLEIATNVPWTKLGLYVGESPAALFEGDQVVLIPNAATRDPLVPPASEQIERDGRTYDVTRWVTWVDEGGGQDYKRVVVELSWQAGDRTHLTRSESLRAPEPDEAGTLRVAFTRLENARTAGEEIPITSQASASPYRNADGIAITIEVSHADATVQLVFTDQQGIERTLGLPGPGTTRNLPITAGSWRFPNGPFSFIVTAETGGPTPQTATNVDTVHFIHPLVVSTPSVAHVGGEPVLCRAGGTPVSDVLVTVTVDGVTGADAAVDGIVLAYPGGSVPLNSFEQTDAGGRFEVTVPRASVTAGETFTISAVRDRDTAEFDATASQSTTVPSRTVDAATGVCT